MATRDPADVARGRLTLRVIRERLRHIVEARGVDDPHLHLLDGLSLYGEDDADTHPLPDALHPSAETYRLMGERFARLALATGGRLG